MENNTAKDHFDQAQSETNTDKKSLSTNRRQNERRKKHIADKTEKCNVYSAIQIRAKGLRLSAKEKLRTGAESKHAGSKDRQSLAAQRGKQRPGYKSMWEKGQNHRQVSILPVSEEEFLKDMLSPRPRFRSRSQLKPTRYWERVAAAVPAYQGPWQPGLPTMKHGG